MDERGHLRGEAPSLSSVRLSHFGLRREPPRPLDDRDVGYESLFDYDTLFYDVFLDTGGAQIVCLGPPLLNCEERIRSARFYSAQTGAPIAWRFVPPPTHLQPSCRFTLDLPLGASGGIVMEVGDQRAELTPQPSGEELFADRRVLLTLAKDYPLEWMQDWAEFNSRIHGANAVLLYDNGSSLHSIAEIRNALTAVPGLSTVAVVPWNFPYGPGVGPRNIQDSFFCQPGVLEHARRRFCGQAAGVLNTDIDELVASHGGGSIFTALEESGEPAILFAGIWTEKVRASGQAEPEERPGLRHSDCLHNQSPEVKFRKSGRLDRLGRTKWVLAPRRCGEEITWQVHGVDAVSDSDAEAVRRPPSDAFLYRHFRQINTGWKTPRHRIFPYSRAKHRYDWDMARSMRRAFPDRDLERPGDPISRLLSRLVLRRQRRRNAKGSPVR